MPHPSRRANRRSRPPFPRRRLELEPLESRQLLAGVQFLGDLNPEQNGSYPRDLVELNGSGYFFGQTLTQQGLFRSDATAAGTGLVKQLNNGFMSELTTVGGQLFFSAYTAETGVELWSSDGTEAGTRVVKDIVPGIGHSSPRNLTNVNGTLFFWVNGAKSGEIDFWKSDGTADGTVRLRAFSQSSADALSNRAAVGETLYFAAANATSGVELWKSNGTAAGTVLVKEIAAGATGSSPSQLVNVSGKLFFSANDGGTGSELWASNGTSAGTVRLKDIAAGAASSNPAELVNVNGSLFFAARNSASGTELWKSNGTAAGTVRVKDIVPGETSSEPAHLTNVQGNLFFATRFNGSSSLWKSDGTGAGTTRVRGYLDFMHDIANVGSTVFFVSGAELWKSNGSEAGTFRLKQFTDDNHPPNPSQLTNVGGKLLFAGLEAQYGLELWKSDGTRAGTTLVSDLSPGTRGSDADQGANVNGTLFFGPGDGALWKSQGTPATTRRLSDLESVREHTNVNGTLFFSAVDPVAFESGLWKSDGTESGTTLVSDLIPDTFFSLYELTNVGGTLFFAMDHYGEFSLWKSDGTTSGTSLLKQFSTEGEDVPFQFRPQELTDVNGTLYFAAGDQEAGVELWKSDGTPEGTVRVKDLGPGDSYPQDLTNVNGTLFFAPRTDVSERLLWKSDGTEAGTVAISANYYPRELVNVGGTLFFNGLSHLGLELWKSDGTQSGTVIVKDIVPNGSSHPTGLVNVGGTLLFGALGAAGNWELWRSDGTSNGTVQVHRLYPQEGAQYLTPLANVEGRLYFSAKTANRYDLWRSDGTRSGTVKVFEGIARASDEGRDLNANGTFFFSASTPEFGTELYAVPPDPNRAPQLDTTPDPKLWSIFEDTTNSLGTPIKLLVDTEQTDPDANAKQGIAIVGATGTTNGRWQYSLDGGQQWRWIGNVAGTDARLLPANDLTRVRFVPYKDFHGQVGLSYRAWDQTQGVAGGSMDLQGLLGSRNAFSWGLETASLTVKPVNDAPLLTVSAASLSYVHDANAIVLARTAKVSDVDSANFAGGRLKVHIDTGGSTSNRLGIGGFFFVDASGNVSYLDKIIGKRTKGGYGLNDLIVEFNESATSAIVQELTRAITFKTIGGAAGQRSVLFSLSDGDSGFSAEAVKTVNVT